MEEQHDDASHAVAFSFIFGGFAGLAACMFLAFTVGSRPVEVKCIKLDPDKGMIVERLDTHERKKFKDVLGITVGETFKLDWRGR